MSDEERGAHLRALERMGIRLVPRPSDALLTRLGVLVALAENPDLFEAVGVESAVSTAILGTETTKAAVAEVRGWLEQVGWEVPSAETGRAKLLEGVRRFQGMAPMRPAPVPIPSPPPRCRHPGCERDMLVPPRRVSLDEAYVPPDGYCLEHAQAGLATREQIAEQQRALRHQHAAEGVLPFAQPFWRGGNVNVCGEQAPGFPGLVCRARGGHEGEHQYVAVP